MCGLNSKLQTVENRISTSSLQSYCCVVCDNLRSYFDNSGCELVSISRKLSYVILRQQNDIAVKMAGLQILKVIILTTE